MIYYIYKVRRKQTSIRSSRSALSHRYLRCISWISWNSHRPQPFTSWVASPQSATFSRRCLCHKAAIVARPYLCFHPEGRPTPSGLSSRKRKQLSFLFSARLCVSFLLCCSAYKLFARAACGRSIACPPPRRFPRPSHKQKMRARSCRREPAHHVYLTCSKKRRLPAQESTRRHARLTRSCFGRKNLFIDGPHSLQPFFLSPFLQRKRKKKKNHEVLKSTLVFLTTFGKLTLTRWPAAPRPLKFM